MHRTLMLLAVLICLGMAGCAYHGPLASMPPVNASGAAELVIIRESAFASGGAPMTVTIDNLPVFAIENGANVSLQIKAGEHLVGVRFEGMGLGYRQDSFIQITLKAGEKRYLLLSPHPGGGFYPYASIAELALPEGEARLQKSKPSGQPPSP